MRTRSHWLALAALTVAFGTGCRPAQRYVDRRVRDAADSVQAEIGLGAPIYARVKVTDFAVVGAGYAVSCRVGIDGRPNVLDRASIDERPQSRLPAIGELGIPFIYNDEWSDDRAVVTWGPCVTRRQCLLCPDHGPRSALAHKFWVGGAGALLLSARVGINALEVVDFVAGIFCWDLLGDDAPVAEFLELAFKGKTRHVTDLLAENPALANAADARGRKALHWAVSWPNSPGHLQVVGVLLANGAEVNTADDLGITPLHLASSPHRRVFAEHLAAAKFLIAAGADATVAAKDGSTALHRAVAASYPELAALLIANGAPVNARDDRGRTPLALADELTGGDVADVLIRNGAQR
ncbi:ankyrin repeat domain-containing protein [bacterium]|nr:ankyrin repeat domain-containing protein [bacterium]